MAFTVENKADAYLFFALAFNAAPGSVYGDQIVGAYNAGMTTKQIVNVYTTKEQFTKLYPATQTNAEFAAALVANVVGATATDAVKAAAQADIVAALTAGLSKGDVIFNVLGNLSKKDTADAAWGKTVAMINNKIAVAKALTEGAKALSTTDVALLQGPLKGVTEDVATVQSAINGAGSLADKLATLAIANKAKADFAASLDLDGNGKVDNLTSATAQAAVTADVAAKALLVEGKVAGWTAATTTAQKDALVAVVKANNDAAVTAAQKTVTDDNAAIVTLKVTAAQVSQYKVLAANVDATTTASTAADAVQAGKLTELNTLTGGAVTIAGNGAVTDYIVVDGAGKLSLDATATTKVTDANKAVVTALLNSIVAAQTAAANKTNAATAKTQFETELDKADGAATGAEKTAIEKLITDEKAVVTAQKANPDLDKLLANYAASKANDTKLVDLDKAITAANKAFTDAGLPVPVEVNAALTATAGDDTYIIGAVKTGDIGGFGALGKDSIFVGKDYVLNATGDLTKGDATKLEVFFKANGANTDVYVEQKAFDSNASGTPDIVKITLTGVAADKLVLKDGFVALA